MVSLSAVRTSSPLWTWEELLKLKLERILTFAADPQSFPVSLYLSPSDLHLHPYEYYRIYLPVGGKTYNMSQRLFTRTLRLGSVVLAPKNISQWRNKGLDLVKLNKVREIHEKEKPCCPCFQNFMLTFEAWATPRPLQGSLTEVGLVVHRNLLARHPAIFRPRLKIELKTTSLHIAQPRDLSVLQTFMQCNFF